MKRLFKLILFIGILLLGIAGVAIYWTFYRPLPNYETSIRLSELNQPVNIKWDSYGVPHIYASNKHDLYTALGYVHARDRLWQMTVSQMAAQGRFAEFLGKDLLPVDKFQRMIGFWRIAQKMQKKLPDSTRAVLQAYADGVNRYEKQHPDDLPIQLALAGMEPIRWTPTHSLALARLLAWQLNIAWRTELNYNLLYHKLSPTQFKDLFPNPKISSHLPSAAPDSAQSAVISSLLQTAQRFQPLMGTAGTHTGSNAWAVAGAKSTNNKPLLAGDPHLALSIPNTWYEVHLNLNGRNLSGATLPGAPSVVLGQNDALAWSFTNVMLDDTDFFEEKVDPDDSTRYMIDSLAGEPVYQNFKTQHEVIKIKGEEDQRFTRKLTDHGPVISGVIPDSQSAKPKIISMQWTGQKPGRELQALQKMGWARNMTEFEEGVRQFKSPAQNVIYADTSGNIGLFTAADIPLRSGNPILLRPGWKSQWDWHGMVSWEDLPRIVNPQKGWVANANNPVSSADRPYYMSVYWQPKSRYNRIKHYLSSNQQLNTRGFEVMQKDVYSDYARNMTDLILPALHAGNDARFSFAINYLKNWDYTYGTSETAASIMDVFLLHLTRNTLQDEMSKELYNQFITYSAKPARIMLRMMRNSSSFFDDVSTTKTEKKTDIIQKSMNETLAFLKENFGNKPADWHWQNLHQLRLEAPLFGRAAEDSSASSALKLIVDNVLNQGPYPAAGNSMTINNGEYLWQKPFDMVVGASIRRIVDLSDTRRSLSIMPGGQSGNPLSDFYNDQTQSWLNGQYKYLNHDSSYFHRYKNMRLIPER